MKFLFCNFARIVIESLFVKDCIFVVNKGGIN